MRLIPRPTVDAAVSRPFGPIRAVGVMRRAWIGAALALAFGLSACGEAPPTSQPQVNSAEALAPGTEVVARVNGAAILKADVLAEAVKRGWITVAEDLDPASPQFTRIVDELVQQKLFALEAETQKLDQDPDVRRRLELAREIILADALRNKMVAEVASEASIERFYRERAGQIPLGQKVRARIITTATRDDAESARRQIGRGESFAAVAFERSQDAQTRAEGGDLGEFLPEQLPDGLRQAAETTPIGQVAGPIQTSRGWHLLKVESRRQEETPSLEQLRPEIQRWLVFDAMNALYERLSGAARIERLAEDAGVDLPPDASGDATTEEPETPADQTPPPSASLPMGPGALAGAAGRDLVKGATPAPAQPRAPTAAASGAPAPRPTTPAPTPAATTAAPAAPKAAAPQPKATPDPNAPIIIRPQQQRPTIPPAPTPQSTQTPVAPPPEPGQ